MSPDGKEKKHNKSIKPINMTRCAEHKLILQRLDDWHIKTLRIRPRGWPQRRPGNPHRWHMRSDPDPEKQPVSAGRQCWRLYNLRTKGQQNLYRQNLFWEAIFVWVHLFNQFNWTIYYKMWMFCAFIINIGLTNKTKIQHFLWFV